MYERLFLLSRSRRLERCFSRQGCRLVCREVICAKQLEMWKIRKGGFWVGGLFFLFFPLKKKEACVVLSIELIRFVWALRKVILIIQLFMGFVFCCLKSILRRVMTCTWEKKERKGGCLYYCCSKCMFVCCFFFAYNLRNVLITVAGFFFKNVFVIHKEEESTLAKLEKDTALYKWRVLP